MKSSLSFIRYFSTKHVCIIGSGPSGFYTAKYLLKENAMNDTFRLKVDMIDKLPVPFGLVRRGVAPDHPEVRSVVNDFSKVVEANGDDFKFFGNIEVGRDISLGELRDRYDAILLAHGGSQGAAFPGDLKKTPPSGTPRVVTATEFVDWYNVLPQKDLTQVSSAKNLLKKPDGSHVNHVVIIGHGNVALDVARLLSLSVEELRATDIGIAFQNAVEERNNSLPKPQPLTITVLGRRGPFEASFSNKELREMTNLSNATCWVNPAELEEVMSYSYAAERSANRATKRAFQLFQHLASNSDSAGSHGEIVVRIRFLSSPKSLEDGYLVVEKNTLDIEHNAKSVSTNQLDRIPCDLIVLANGFSPNPLKGVKIGTLPSNEKGIATHEDTAVALDDVFEEDGKGNATVFVTGWAKRGPRGNIATQVPDASTTSANMIKILKNTFDQNEGGKKSLVGNGRAFLEGLGKATTWAQWVKIDAEEKKRGEDVGKSRLRTETIQEMLKIAREQ